MWRSMMQSTHEEPAAIPIARKPERMEQLVKVRGVGSSWPRCVVRGAPGQGAWCGEHALFQGRPLWTSKLRHSPERMEQLVKLRGGDWCPSSGSSQGPSLEGPKDCMHPSPHFSDCLGGLAPEWGGTACPLLHERCGLPNTPLPPAVQQAAGGGAEGAGRLPGAQAPVLPALLLPVQRRDAGDPGRDQGVCVRACICV